MGDKLKTLHAAGILGAEEVIIFYNANSRNNVHGMLPYRNYNRFVLEEMDESKCLVDFRFEVFKCKNGLIVYSVKTLCTCLRRLSYTC